MFYTLTLSNLPVEQVKILWDTLFNAPQTFHLLAQLKDQIDQQERASAGLSTPLPPVPVPGANPELEPS